MRFEPLTIPGPVLVVPDPHVDVRGLFARSFCEAEFAAAGLPVRFPQHNISFNHRAGTVRGMHYAAAPHRESKLVRCTAGVIHDVAVDLRAGSATFGQAVSATLSASSHAALYIPPGFAHGFQTLQDDTEVLYLMGAVYDQAAARGLRWNDPLFSVSWPLPVSVISDRDATYPDARMDAEGGLV